MSGLKPTEKQAGRSTPLRSNVRAESMHLLSSGKPLETQVPLEPENEYRVHQGWRAKGWVIKGWVVPTWIEAMKGPRE